MFLKIKSKRWLHPNIIPIHSLYKWENKIDGETEYIFMIVMKKALCNFKDVAKKVANKKVTLTAE